MRWSSVFPALVRLKAPSFFHLSVVLLSSLHNLVQTINSIHFNQAHFLPIGRKLIIYVNILVSLSRYTLALVTDPVFWLKVRPANLFERPELKEYTMIYVIIVMALLFRYSFSSSRAASMENDLGGKWWRCFVVTTTTTLKLSSLGLYGLFVRLSPGITMVGSYEFRDDVDEVSVLCHLKGVSNLFEERNGNSFQLWVVCKNSISKILSSHHAFQIVNKFWFSFKNYG